MKSSPLQPYTQLDLTLVFQRRQADPCPDSRLATGPTSMSKPETHHRQVANTTDIKLTTHPVSHPSTNYQREKLFWRRLAMAHRNLAFSLWPVDSVFLGLWSGEAEHNGGEGTECSPRDDEQAEQQEGGRKDTSQRLPPQLPTSSSPELMSPA